MPDESGEFHVSPQSVALSQPICMPPIHKYVAVMKSFYSRDGFGCPMESVVRTGILKKFNLTLLKKEIVERDARLFRRCAMYGGAGAALDAVESPLTLDQVAGYSGTCLRPRCVLVVGAPGAGKSTLTCELCRLWARGELLAQYSLVLLLRLYDRKVREAAKLRDLFYSCDGSIRSEVVKDVKRNGGQGMLVILDGYDEGILEEACSSTSFLAGLLTGQVLPEATLLVTTSPSVYVDVLTCCMYRGVDQHVEICGLATGDVRSFAQDAFVDHLDVGVMETFNQLCAQSHVFWNALHIPANLAVLVELCLIAGTDLPMTSTQLYTALVLKIVSQHLDGHPVTSLSDLPVYVYNKLVALGQMAYRGVVNNVVVFSESDLPGADTLGLVNFFPDLYSEGTCGTAACTCRFLNTTIQQFLAGFFLSVSAPQRQIEAVCAMKGKREMRMIATWRFWAGLSQLQTVPSLMLEAQSSSWSLGIEDIWMLYEAQNMLALPCNLEVKFETDPRVGLIPVDYYILGYCISHSNHKWDVKLTGCSMSETAGDMFVMGATVSCLSDGSITQLWMEGFDPSPGSLRSFLSCRVCETMKELSLVNDTFSYETSEVLATCLPTLPDLESLCLAGNPHFARFKTIMTSIIQHGKIQKLSLGGIIDDYTPLVELLISPSALRVLHCPLNVVPSRHFEGILDALGASLALMELRLSHSKFSLHSTEKLVSVLKINSTLKVLDLQHCNIQTAGICMLAEGLMKNVSLSKLYLSGNHVEDVGAAAIADALKKNGILSALYLKDCDIGTEGACSLASALCQNRALITLDLSGNPIGKEGTAAIFNMLSLNRTLTDLNIANQSVLTCEPYRFAGSLLKHVAFQM